MPDDKQPMKNTGVVFPDSMLQWLQNRAKQNQGSVSQVVRSLVQKAMDEEAEQDNG